MNDHDREMFSWVRKFNPYDLYSKSETKPKLADFASLLHATDR